MSRDFTVMWDFKLTYILSCRIYGVTCLQVYLYYTEYCGRDRLYLKLFVPPFPSHFSSDARTDYPVDEYLGCHSHVRLRFNSPPKVLIFMFSYLILRLTLGRSIPHTWA